MASLPTTMSPAKAKTVHGGESFARLTSIHPAQGKAPDAKVICQTKVRPRRVLRLWDAWIGLCKRLTRWSRSRSRDEPLRRPLADVSLNHSRCTSRRTEEVDEDALSFTSASTTGTCTKLQGDAHLVEWWSASPEASPQPSTAAEWPNRHGGLTLIGLMESTAGRP